MVDIPREGPGKTKGAGRHPTGAGGDWGWGRGGQKARRTRGSAPVKLLAA